MSNTSLVLTTLAVLFVLLLGYSLYNLDSDRSFESNRSLGDRINDVFDPPKQDATPGEKLGDDVKSLGDKIKDNSKPTNNDE